MRFCHASGCETRISGLKLFCAKHWRMVPHPFKQRILENYTPRQGDEGTAGWVDSIRAAIRVLRDIEHAHRRVRV